jgi:hypothetical protein
MRETGTDQQAAQFLDSYMLIMMMMSFSPLSLPSIFLLSSLLFTYNPPCLFPSTTVQRAGKNYGILLNTCPPFTV